MMGQRSLDQRALCNFVRPSPRSLCHPGGHRRQDGGRTPSRGPAGRGRRGGGLWALRPRRQALRPRPDLEEVLRPERLREGQETLLPPRPRQQWALRRRRGRQHPRGGCERERGSGRVENHF